MDAYRHTTLLTSSECVFCDGYNKQLDVESIEADGERLFEAYYSPVGLYSVITKVTGRGGQVENLRCYCPACGVLYHHESFLF